MRPQGLIEAYHKEQAVAVNLDIQRYLCACERCHGLRHQDFEVVEIHHLKYGRDQRLNEPLLSCEVEGIGGDEPVASGGNTDYEEDYHDAMDGEDPSEIPKVPEVNLKDMAKNFFNRVDDIHQQYTESEEESMDLDKDFSDDEQDDQTDLQEDLIHKASIPLFPGSRSSKLQFSVILMLLCTLFSISHCCLDKILTFLKNDVLPVDNSCPSNSYEIKRLVSKLRLSHENIHCCECGKTLYWRENATLDSCLACQKSRYILGSTVVPNRVLRYFSIIKRLRRMFRCPKISRHMRWHSENHSTDGKLRFVVDSEQWTFIDQSFPSFTRDARNVQMGLALDGVNPYSQQSSKHYVWPVMIVFYNLPPYLLTKRFFISLSMIIPGPNSPSEDTIDVFLQPLILELQKLWRGISAVDMFETDDTKRYFKLRGMLLWTINDFPAYTLIAGQVGKGNAGCPVCGEGTSGKYFKEAEKTTYLGHRRWLDMDHHWRQARGQFDGTRDLRVAPPRQMGLTIKRLGELRESYLKVGGRQNGSMIL